MQLCHLCQGRPHPRERKEPGCEEAAVGPPNTAPSPNLCTLRHVPYRADTLTASTPFASPIANLKEEGALQLGRLEFEPWSCWGNHPASAGLCSTISKPWLCHLLPGINLKVKGAGEVKNQCMLGQVLHCSMSAYGLFCCSYFNDRLPVGGLCAVAAPLVGLVEERTFGALVALDVTE